MMKRFFMGCPVCLILAATLVGCSHNTPVASNPSVTPGAAPVAAHPRTPQQQQMRATVIAAVHAGMMRRAAMERQNKKQ